MSQICIISYFSSKEVGGVRTGYWFENLTRLSNGRYEPDLVTAQEVELAGQNVHLVRPLFRINFDQGLGWIFPLFRFLSNNYYKYDCFVFSCGPFLQLALVPWIKLICRKKVIIDYRDPFSFNPVFKDNFLKRFLKTNFEPIFNFYADHIVTVNKVCRELIKAPSGITISLIDNGFDERVSPRLNDVIPDSSVVLAGSFSHGRDVSSFIECLITDFPAYKLVHLGKKGLDVQTDKYVYLGSRSYSETLGVIDAASVCLIFTSGHPYESTTKIFDYLRFNKKILIIADAIPDEGGLFDLTKNEANVIWSRNEKESISMAMRKLIESDLFEDRNHDFLSRNEGTRKLINILDKVLCIKE